MQKVTFHAKFYLISMKDINVALNVLYLEDLHNIDNIKFEQMVQRINPAEHQLNKVNASDTEASFLDLT